MLCDFAHIYRYFLDSMEGEPEYRHCALHTMSSVSVRDFCLWTLFLSPSMSVSLVNHSNANSTLMIHCGSYAAVKQTDTPKANIDGAHGILPWRLRFLFLFLLPSLLLSLPLLRLLLQLLMLLPA
jgi:hypothetical protein